MKVLVFGASSSSQSINQQFAIHAANVFKDEIHPDAEIEVINLNDFEMPIYSQDLEKEGGIPDLAQDFFDKIGAADGLIISFAEHNGGYTAAFKNIYDWASRIDAKVYQGTPMVALSTSPGKGGASSVLNSAIGSAGFFGAKVVGSLSLPEFFASFDPASGKVTNPELAAQLKEQLTGLAPQ